MTTRTTTTEENQPSARALIGMTAATVALLGGVLLWQAQLSGEKARPGTATSMGGIREGIAPLGSPRSQHRAPGQAIASNTPGSDLAVYFVASDEGATDLRLALSQYETLGGRGGTPPSTLVLVAGWLETEHLAGLVPPGAHIYDMRAPGVRGPASDPAVVSDQEMYQRWQQAQVTA